MTKARVLIVEDESIVSKDIQNRLHSLGYVVAGAVVSGEAAIEQAGVARPDLVLMDIQLKGPMDGVEAARHIRERFDIPVVYLTAHSDDVTLQRAKITEPFGYLIKPFEERDLHTTIEMALYKHAMDKELRWQSNVNAGLAELGRALISPMALEDIAWLVLEQAKRLTGSRFGFVGHIDPQTGHLVSSTLTRDIWEGCQVEAKSFVFDKFSGLWGWVLENRQSLLTNTPADDPRSSGVPQGHIPIQRFLSAPAMVDETLVGQVALANADHEYTGRDLAVVEWLAALYALAIHRARIEQEIREMNRRLEQRVAERTAQLAAANEALRQSEARLRHIYENAPVMIHTLDADERICDVNRKWLEETGYAREEVLGRRHDFLMTPESAERAFSAVLPQLEREGLVRDVPYQYVKKSGAVIDVLLDCQATADPSGQRVDLAVVRNVTDQRRAERRLRLQGAALEAAANAIVITNRDGRISWANPAFTHLTGYSLEEIVGQTMRVLKSGQHDPAFYRDLWETILAGRVWRGELVNRRQDGSLYVEEQIITPVKDERGEITHFVAIKQDVTEHKRAQTRMLHADRLAAAGKLAASVAHEINNPLQSVIGCLGLAQEALAEGEDAGQYLQVAREEVRRIARIVARMRDLYRPESGEKRLVEVDTLMAQVLELTRQRCQESRVAVDWRPAAGLPPLLLAPDQIKQVFLNLLLNAVDAMPDGGQLQVTMDYTPAPPGVRIRFSDTGVGIAPDVLPRIFESFYSTKPEGTGLGLSISSNIVEQHGGDIQVESRPGEGSTFSVWLPA